MKKSFLDKYRKKDGAPVALADQEQEESLGESSVPSWVDEGGEFPVEKKVEIKLPRNEGGKLRVLVIDNGLFPCVAEALKEHAKVEYFVDWQNGAPTIDHHYVGYGIEGVGRIDSAFNRIRGLDNKRHKIGAPDLVVFPDVGNGDWAEEIKEKDIPVFSTFYSEDLEDDRVKFRELLKSLGMLHSPYVVIKGGIDKLRDHLKTVKNKWVKLSLYRGHGETFYHEDYERSRPELNRLAHQLGILDIYTEFVVEDPIDDAIEIGAEWFRSDQGFFPKGMYGYEVKNRYYDGQISRYDKLPEAIKSVMDKFDPIYNKYGVRGELSVEMRVTKKGSYFIDPCQRFASPPGESVSKAYKNLLPMMMAAATGKSVMPEEIARYFSQFMLHCNEKSNEPVRLDVPEKFNENVAFRNLYIDPKGRRHFLPIAGETICGAACGWGDSLEESRAMALEVAQSVKGDIHFFEEAVKKADSQIEDGRKLGIQF